MNMRYLICLLFVSGCVMQSLPPDDGVAADLSCEAARMVVKMRAEIAPAPPKPTPDAKCPNCLGTGKIGDGRIIMPCPVCKGTGKACKDGTCPQ